MVMANVFSKKEWISDLEYQSEIETTTEWFNVDAVCKYRNGTAVIIIVNILHEVQKITVADKGLLKDIVINFFSNKKNSDNKFKILYTKDIKTANIVYERLMDLYFNDKD